MKKHKIKAKVTIVEKTLKYHYTLINRGNLLDMYKQKGKSGLTVSVLHFVYVDLYANGYKYPHYTIN